MDTDRKELERLRQELALLRKVEQAARDVAAQRKGKWALAWALESMALELSRVDAWRDEHARVTP